LKYPKIVVLPPGPKSRAIINQDKVFASPSLSRIYPLVVNSADGCIIRDVDGNEFIDFCSNLGVMLAGHNHCKIVEAIKQQSEKLIFNSSLSSFSEIPFFLSKKLSKITPIKSEKKKIIYSHSGEEAIEAGIKTAMWHTHNHRLLAFLGAYHGSTLGALSLSAVNSVKSRYFSALLVVNRVPYPYCYRCYFKQSYPDCNYYCIDYIEELFQRNILPEEIAAIVFEPIQEEAGCIIPPSGYFQRLKKVMEKFGVLMVDDESNTSLGRVGRWCAIQDWKVKPDIVCLAGSLSSGLPLGATIATKELMDLEPASQNSILGGNSLACAASLAVIDVIRSEHLLENSTRQGDYVLNRLREIAESYPIIGDIRGKGLMIGIEIVKDQKERKPGIGEALAIIRKSFRQGLLTMLRGSSVVEITPPLGISRELIDQGLEIIESSVSEVTQNI